MDSVCFCPLRNSSYFIFSGAQLLSWYKKYVPAAYRSLVRIQKALLLEPARLALVLSAEYKKARLRSLDYELIEKLPDKWILPADFYWTDIGHWRSVRDVQILAKKKANITNAQYVQLDSSGNLLYSFSHKLIATLGLQDMVLVETDQVIFLCPVSRAHEVKKLLKKIKSEQGSKYL